ncbi:MAG: hypothetical protein A2007_03500 [Verrucomicrobia bacterium GWC2_42_7]|nr:MAG: hypothetical protein A2007_03500 [Verrucomicrobia bacterium GWC2_42_7]
MLSHVFKYAPSPSTCPPSQKIELTFFSHLFRFPKREACVARKTLFQDFEKADKKVISLWTTAELL